MAIIRGSTHLLQAIKEVTFGTTPATPALTEIPLTNFAPKSAQTVMRSGQIRSHPYVDRMMYGRYVHTIGLDFELQGPNHDFLFETFFGGTITAKALAFADTLKSLTMESAKGGGSSKFDQFTGVYFDSFTVTASASDTEGVKVTTTGMAKTGVLDAAATLASTQTAATPIDPFIFADATLKVATVSTAVVSGDFNIKRQVDPLMLWASRTPREFIPGAVTVTGNLTIPYDDGTQSTIVSAFSDAAIEMNFNNNGSTVFRKFTFPKAKLTDIGRQVNTRGGIMQVIPFEAYYDTGTTTVCTMTTQ